MFIIVFSIDNSLWTIISPVVISFVLIKLTGIKISEQNMLKTIPGYREYMKSTSVFILWFPKK